MTGIYDLVSVLTHKAEAQTLGIMLHGSSKRVVSSIKNPTKRLIVALKPHTFVSFKTWELMFYR